MIADALEITRDLDCTDDEAKVARHRLLQRQQRDRALLDFDLEVVDLVVGGEHGFRFARVPLAKRFHGKINQRLRLF